MLVSRTPVKGLKDDQTKKVLNKNEVVESDGYKFRIGTNEKYWAGHPHKMEDMAGFFMTTTVSLIEAPDSSTAYEKIAAENRLVLYKKEIETSSQFDNYAEQYHLAMVENVRDHSKEYLKRVPEKVKDHLEKGLR
jgi:hypothetical protein